MPQSDAQSRAVRKYLAKFEEVRFRVPKGERQKIHEYAASKGESLNVVLYRLVKEAMERDGIQTNSEK